MAIPSVSDVSARGVRVEATAVFSPDNSDPADRNYVFVYSIVIVNDGDAPVQLISRHWIIIDANGRREEVQGPGVVGETPRLEPGQSFKYQSYCPLKTAWGTMEGTYQMKCDDGEPFNVTIPRFYLKMN